MSDSIPADPPRRLLSPQLVLILAVIAGYCLLVQFPLTKRRFGIFDNGMWFLDSYAILASSDAVQAGLDPSQPNPLDVFQRKHSYSDWWFLLSDAGLTRKDNFLLGGSWVLAFGVAALALLRPRTYTEAGLAVAVLLSPPVVLAVFRANNDLVVFVLVAAGLWGLRAAQPRRVVWFIAALVLATGLKFYPFIAAVALLVLRPPKQGLVSAGMSLLAGLVTFATVWSDFKRAAFPAPVQLYTFGAPVIFRDLGWTGSPPLLFGAALLGLAALVCVHRGWTVRLDDLRDDLRARLMFAAGAALLVGCFLAGISHAYRLIFVVLLVPLLWQTPSRPVASWTFGLLLAALWLDGLCSLATNLLKGPMPLAESTHWQLILRYATQPVAWVAMALLAGALLGLALSIWREAKVPA